jgi:hypothetical protein
MAPSPIMHIRLCPWRYFSQTIKASCVKSTYAVSFFNKSQLPTYAILMTRILPNKPMPELLSRHSIGSPNSRSSLACCRSQVLELSPNIHSSYLSLIYIISFPVQLQFFNLKRSSTTLIRSCLRDL